MNRLLLRVLFSHWQRHPFQLMTLIVGLALATGLWVAVQAINSEARASYASAQSLLAGAQTRKIIVKTGNLQVSDYVALRRAGWPVAPMLEGRLKIGTQHIDLIGVDLLNSPHFLQLQNGSDQAVDATDFLKMVQGRGTLIVHPQTAMKLELSAQLPKIDRSNAIPLGSAVGDISIVSGLLNKPNALTHLVFTQKELSAPQNASELPAHLQIVQTNRDTTQNASLTDSFHLNLTAFGFLSFAVGLFIVQGAVSLALEQRRTMMRTLRCLGLSRLQLVLGLVLELALITLSSSIIGLFLGYYIAILLLPDVSRTLSGLYNSWVDSSLSLRMDWIISGLVMAFLGSLAASVQSFVALWKLPVLQLPSTRARGQQILNHFGAGATSGAALITAGIMVLLTGRSLLGGFIFLAGVMLGAAMILPFFLNLLLRFGQAQSKHPLIMWLWADSRAQLPGLSLSLMALLLALATNIGVGTMVSSFRLTFDGWLDQRLAAELYVSVKSKQQGQNIERWLTVEGHRVLPTRSIEVRFAGQNLKVYGIKDDPTYRENWPVLQSGPNAWDDVAQGRGVMINEQLSRQMGLHVGDRLGLPAGWPNQVSGIYSDYGNPKGQMLVSLPTLLRLNPDLSSFNQSFGVRLSPDDLPKVIEHLRRSFGLARDDVVDQAQIKARSIAIFDQTFVVTSALNILTLGVAGFSIFTSLATLWEQRLPQLAPVWAMGVRRTTLAWFDILRSLLIASLTALLALPLGLVLAWALLDIINTEAFGWRLPMHVFPGLWLRLIVLAQLAAIIAAVISAWRLMKLQPNDLLRVFSNDR